LGYILRSDAYTYLPLCILGISIFQFNTLLTYYFEGFFMLSQSIGYILLFAVLLAVLYLKIENIPKLKSSLHRKTPSVFSDSPPTRRIKLLIFVFSFVVYVLIGFRVTNQLVPSGDEPHYLLVAHSILHDHDLKIDNNYTQRHYQSFLRGELDPHLSLAKDGTVYSVHLPGLPLLILPGYMFYGRQGAVICINLLAALLAVQLYLLAFSITQNKGFSLILWFVTSFTSPLLILSSQIYPAIPTALFVITAYRISHSRRAEKVTQSLLLGSVLAFIPWQNQRVALLAILLFIYHLAVSWIRIKKQRIESNERRISFLKFFMCQPSVFLPTIVFALSGIVMATSFYAVYGSPLPTALHASTQFTDFFSLEIFLKEGLLGNMIDQATGVLIFAPYYVFFFAGLFLLLRRDLIRTLLLIAVILTVYVPCGAFVRGWRGAWSPVSRYMVAIIPLFLVPVFEGIKHATRTIFRYIFIFLVFISFYWSYLFLHTPFLSIMRRTGINPAFEKYSSIVDLTRYFPSFPAVSPRDYVLIGTWVALIAVFSFWLYRSGRGSNTHQVIIDRSQVSEHRIVQKTTTVLIYYGLILGAFIVLTGVIDQFDDHYTVPQLNKNRQLRTFLNHFGYKALAQNLMAQQQPIQPENFRFEYLGRVRHGNVNRDLQYFMVSGPHEFFPKNPYTAYFEIAVADNSVDDVVVTIEASTRRGRTIFAQKSLRGVDFSEAGQYELVPLPFVLEEDIHDLETRVFFHDRVDVSVKKVYIEPDVAELYYKAGLTALRNSNYREAKMLFLRAAAASQHVLARYQLGVIAQLSGNKSEAIELFRQIIKESPDFADAYYRLGVLFQEQEKIGYAQQYLRKATEWLPTHLDAWKTLQKIVQESAQESEAENIHQTITTLYHPQYPHAVNFGNQVMFLGYTIQNSLSGKLLIDYYWKALSPMNEDYTFFVHFKQYYRTKFQQDHEPQKIEFSTDRRQDYPTSQWQVGELVHEQFEITAPAGTFDIYLGVWDPVHTKERLPVISPSQQSLFKKKETELKTVHVK